MAKEENTTKKTTKKPEYQKFKTVYFNNRNGNDVQLYKYVQSVGSRNFSGWIKSLIYQEMVRRNGVPPNPYEFAMQGSSPMMTTTVPVSVNHHDIDNDDSFKITRDTNGHEDQDDYDDSFHDEEETNEDPIDEAEQETVATTEEAPSNSRRSLAKNFAQQFKPVGKK